MQRPPCLHFASLVCSWSCLNCICSEGANLILAINIGHEKVALSGPHCARCFFLCLCRHSFIAMAEPSRLSSSAWVTRSALALQWRIRSTAISSSCGPSLLGESSLSPERSRREKGRAVWQYGRKTRVEDTVLLTRPLCCLSLSFASCCLLVGNGRIILGLFR